MKANIRSRNITVNSFLGILLITLTGAAASFFILHIAHDAPLSSVFVSATELPN